MFGLIVAVNCAGRKNTLLYCVVYRRITVKRSVAQYCNYENAKTGNTFQGDTAPQKFSRFVYYQVGLRYVHAVFSEDRSTFYRHVEGNNNVGGFGSQWLRRWFYEIQYLLSVL